MRKACLFILILLVCSLRAVSQDLVGKISDSDSAGTVLYQAEVTQSQNGKVIATVKTFFDGSYHIKVKPNQTYEIKATYPGRKDSTITISVDKNGSIYAGTLFISLYKNGLRLMGYVMDREEDLPIKDAGITIRNVMTRKEDKYFTDVNGYYNLRMDFETNYTFKIDKRSPGIINKFQDTSFNISTIGFNQPLDFRLDIKLGPAEGHTKQRSEYDPYAQPDNKNLKPVVEVVGKRDSIKAKDKAAALAELNKKLHSKDSAIASIDKKLNDINQAKKGETASVKATEDQKKKEAADKLKAEQDSQLAAMEAKRKAQEKANADLKALVLAEKEQQEKEAADKKRKQEEAAMLKQKAAQEKKAAAEKKKADEALHVKEQEENEQKRKVEAALLAKQLQDSKPKNTSDEQARVDKESSTIAKADSLRALKDKAKEQKAKDQAIAKDAADQKAVKKEDKQTKYAHPDVIITNADSVPMTDKQKREEKERDLIAMKRARETAEAKMLTERREREAQEKAAKKESKRLAKELAEQNKQRKKADEEERKLAEAKLRATQKKAQDESEQRDLEAKKAQEEQEKHDLISQREKLLNDQQVRVAKDKENKEPYNNSAKAVQEANQKRTIADWEKKVKNDTKRKVDTASANVISLNTVRPASVKVVKAKGFVKNGQTEDAISNVSINIRRLNGIVSQEVTSDDKGNYEFLVDSGYFYLVSFYRDGYEISKQILDLTSYRKAEYTMLIQYLKEHDEFDPAAKMPAIQFQKNSSKVPDGLWSDLEAIVKMMQEVPQLKMKIYGLGSADEDYPMELSITRARMIADMMLESGVKPARIRINGVGDFRPRSGCVEGKECTQEQYQMDRVVMYKVIKE